MNAHVLSKASQQFLENLRVYLFTSGKRESEINDILQELTEHLTDAEREGKSTEEIVGQSPKAYMESLSSEMNRDYRAWGLKIIPMLLLGATSFLFIQDLLQGKFAYSIIQITGYLLFIISFLGGVLIAFNYLAKSKKSFIKEMTLLGIPVLLSMLILIGALILDQNVVSPMIEFGIVGQSLLSFLMIIFVISFSFWARTFILPIILIAFHLPPILLAYTPLTTDIQSLLATVIAFGVIILYLMFMNDEDDKKSYAT
ncbi:hypothetical protein DH09_12060 [Bacillaceae bacterium JMAK1]|nr:hypothetical protein DH09_12060 [Bacillaceae bacterium JMAK1]